MTGESGSLNGSGICRPARAAPRRSFRLHAPSSNIPPENGAVTLATPFFDGPTGGRSPCEHSCKASAANQGGKGTGLAGARSRECSREAFVSRGRSHICSLSRPPGKRRFTRRPLLTTKCSHAPLYQKCLGSPPEKPPMAKEGKESRPLSEASPGTVPFPFSEPFYRHGPASRVEPWQRIPDVSTFVGPSPSDRETSTGFLQVVGTP